MFPSPRDASWQAWQVVSWTPQRIDRHDWGPLPRVSIIAIYPVLRLLVSMEEPLINNCIQKDTVSPSQVTASLPDIGLGDLGEYVLMYPTLYLPWSLAWLDEFATLAPGRVAQRTRNFKPTNNGIYKRSLHKLCSVCWRASPILRKCYDMLHFFTGTDCYVLPKRGVSMFRVVVWKPHHASRHHRGPHSTAAIRTVPEYLGSLSRFPPRQPYSHH